METTNIEIVSGEFMLHGILAVPNKQRDVGILLLHGGGQSNAERYRDVQKFFYEKGIPSLAIDFRGCGTSQGNMYTSTLLDRLTDAKSTLELFKTKLGFLDNQIFLWGSSMGGHVGSRLVAQFPNLRGLILQSAAAYGKSSEHIKFGPKFTESIQVDGSWKDSLAFTDLSTYSGSTLIIYGKDDQVVPNGIKQRYKLSAKHCKYHILDGYGHSMLRPATDVEKGAWATMVNLGLNFILKK